MSPCAHVNRYTAIPNRTPQYGMDPEAVGLLNQAADVLVGWVQAQAVPDVRIPPPPIQAHLPRVAPRR